MAITYKQIDKTEPFEFSYIEKTDENGLVSFIPIDPANSDYQAYLASLEEPTAKK